MISCRTLVGLLLVSWCFDGAWEALRAALRIVRLLKSSGNCRQLEDERQLGRRCSLSVRDLECLVLALSKVTPERAADVTVRSVMKAGTDAYDVTCRLVQNHIEFRR